MLTMRPYLAFTMCGATARQQRNWLVRLIAQHALPFLDRVVDRRHVRAGDAGVVDQHVDLAELVDRPFAACFDRAGSATSTLGVPSRSQTATFAPEACSRFDDRGADALHAAGDDRGAASEIELIHGETRSIIAALPETMAGGSQARSHSLPPRRRAWAAPRRSPSRAKARRSGRPTSRPAARRASKARTASARACSMSPTSARSRAVAQEVGDVDVLFNCAGIVHHGSILDATPKDWDQASRST